MADYQAAWVPEREDMDWDCTVPLATARVERPAREQRRTPLLVTVTKGWLDSGLGDFARRYEWTSPRSSYRTRLHRGRPVLAYFPDEKTLQVAVGHAHGSSLCVVEGYGTEFGG